MILFSTVNMAEEFFNVQEFHDANDEIVFTIEVRGANAYIAYPDGSEYPLQTYEDNGWFMPDGFSVWMNRNGSVRLNFYNLDGDEQDHANDYFDVNKREFFKQTETSLVYEPNWMFITDKECCTEMFRKGQDDEFVKLPFEYKSYF